MKSELVWQKIGEETYISVTLSDNREVKVVVLPGKFFVDSVQFLTSEKVLTEGKKRGWKQGQDIDSEITTLLLNKLTLDDIKEMGLRSITIMSEPKKHGCWGDVLPSLCCSLRRANSMTNFDIEDFLVADVVPTNCFNRELEGFAFVIS